MDSIFTRVGADAPVVVIVAMVCAYALYRWPFLLLWNALQASNERRDAMSERVIDALINNTIALQALTEKIRGKDTK